MSRGKEQTQELVPTTDLSLPALVRSIPDQVIRQRLGAYLRQRDLSREATWETIAAEFWFHYEVLSNQSTQDKEVTARIQVLLQALGKFSEMYGTWLDKGAIQRVEKEFNALVIDVELLKEVLRERMTKDEYDTTMDLWDAKRSQNISR